MNEHAHPKSDGAIRVRAHEPSQVFLLLFHVAELLGFRTDKDVAEFAGVTPENVANWRTGRVQTLKPVKLKALKESLTTHLRAHLGGQAAHKDDGDRKVCPIHVEKGASPAELQHEFQERLRYDYLGHRFLYYEAMGALAWENLIRRGYDQEQWLLATEHIARDWLKAERTKRERPTGVLAEALQLQKRMPGRSVDVIGLGPGEGAKEAMVLRELLAATGRPDTGTVNVLFVPVDVSIPLLIEASHAARDVIREAATGRPRCSVTAYCADFEEGDLRFLAKLPTARPTEFSTQRLVLMLGNTFGNLRDEASFVRKKLKTLLRPGDLLWLEVATRLDPIESDPLFRMTDPSREETAAEASRRLLLTGPYRRWETATGRPAAALDIRVRLRSEDESAEVPGSVNFCHDLIISDERRACTMLYSRRYDVALLSQWLSEQGFLTLSVVRGRDSSRRERVAHLLLRRCG